jgi:hypothetical protein
MYYNKLKLGRSRFREGNLIYLLRRNIKTIKLNNKLDYKKFDSFKIKRNIKNINYKLHLLLIIRIYLIFYISLLKSANPDTPVGSASEIYFNLREKVYTIEKILKIKKYRKIL